MRTHLAVIGLSGILGTLLWGGTIWSQQQNTQPTADPFTNRQAASQIPVDVTAEPNPFGTVQSMTTVANELLRANSPARKIDELSNKVNEIAKRLRSADELHKPAIVKELEAAVSEQFDEDMKNRDAELAKLDERVTKLRAQLEHRRKAKAEITQLHTKVLVNDAEGLGFSDSHSGGMSAFRNSFSTGSAYGNTFYAPEQELPSSSPVVPPATAPRR